MFHPLLFNSVSRLTRYQRWSKSRISWSRKMLLRCEQWPNDLILRRRRLLSALFPSYMNVYGNCQTCVIHEASTYFSKTIGAVWNEVNWAGAVSTQRSTINSNVLLTCMGYNLWSLGIAVPMAGISVISGQPLQSPYLLYCLEFCSSVSCMKLKLHGLVCLVTALTFFPGQSSSSVSSVFSEAMADNLVASESPKIMVDEYRNASIKQKTDHDHDIATNKAVWDAGCDRVLEEITRLVMLLSCCQWFLRSERWALSHYVIVKLPNTRPL